MDELGRLDAEQYRQADKLPVCLLLDNVRSLHNVGSGFRTADAFRLEQIILTGITGTPPHREIQKTALGATESVPWHYEADPVVAARKLLANGYELLVVEQTTASVPLHRIQALGSKRYCLVFGNEVNGVSEDLLELAHGAIEVPQAGTKHSLNVSVCLGIVAWEFFKQLSALKL